MKQKNDYYCTLNNNDISNKSENYAMKISSQFESKHFETRLRFGYEHCFLLAYAFVII